MRLHKSSKAFRQKPKRFGKTLSNLTIFLFFAVTHFSLQLQLGSFIAGQQSSQLPATTLVSLVILTVAFTSAQINLGLQVGRFKQTLPEKSLLWFIIVYAVSLNAILIFRMPYSNIFLFLGVALQIPLWLFTVQVTKRYSAPVLGVPKKSLPAIKKLVPEASFCIISHSMADVSEIDLVVLKESEISSPDWSEFVVNCLANSISVEEHIGFIERYTRRLDLNRLSFRETQNIMKNNSYIAPKRLIDVVFSLLLLVIVAPLMILLTALIRLETKGNPIFSQQRVGMKGRPFMIYKFRTMKVATFGAIAQYAEKDDTRITKVGRVLRNTRLDELPQLWNVLIGDMSLIGPRPEQVDLLHSIEREIPSFSLRHSLRPGITGWAQVCHGYADDIPSTRIKLSYDLWYVSNVSFILDIYILLRTVKVIMTGFGSR